MKPPAKGKMILSIEAQQYGLTVEDLLARYPHLKKEDIEVEKFTEIRPNKGRKGRGG